MQHDLRQMSSFSLFRGFVLLEKESQDDHFHHSAYPAV